MSLNPKEGVKILTERCEAVHEVLSDRITGTLSAYARGVWVALVRRRLKAVKDAAM
jgi:hypothetical protein